MKTVWVLHTATESGDEEFFVYTFLPTDDRIEADLEGWFPEEYEQVGFVNWNISEVEVIEE